MEVLIIGGIAAGASIAFKAKRTNPDANITIIEKEDYISFGACGLPYYLGDKFDDLDRMFARSNEAARNKGINLLLKHEAINVDFDNKQVEIRNLENNEVLRKSYDKLAICTGAKPLIFGDGAFSENVYTLTKPYDGEKIKKDLQTAKKIAIIGGGFIGIEVADQLSQLNKEITIIHKASSLMNNVFDKEFNELMIKALEEKNIRILLDTEYQKFEVENNKAKKVITNKGEIECDLAILAIGFRPNTSFITDDRLKKIKNGAIISNNKGETSVEDVYAIGDCATVYNPQVKGEFYSPLATYANKMGRIVGENIVSDTKKEYIGAYASGSLLVGDYGIATTGLSEKRAKENGYDIKTKYIVSKNHTSYYPNQEDIHIKLIYEKDSRIILGAQIFGKSGAVERLSALSVSVYKKVTVDELGFIDFAYSPPFAPTWDSLNVAGNAAK